MIIGFLVIGVFLQIFIQASFIVSLTDKKQLIFLLLHRWSRRRVCHVCFLCLGGTEISGHIDFFGRQDFL